MSAENLEVFQGGTFVFEVIGGRFVVHRALVARKSRGLKAMMENGMQESQKGVAPLDDTDVATFGRFVEFLYTGDYNAATPVEPSAEILIANRKTSEDIDSGNDNMRDIPAASEPQEEEPEAPAIEVTAEDLTLAPAAEDDFWGVLSARKESKKRKSRTTDDALASLITEVAIASPIPTDSKFIATGDWSLDFLPVFLSHALLYAFADKYDVQDLQKLAARRLEEALGRFSLSASPATDFASLLQYCYEHTPEREGADDRLRAIVLNFVARNIKTLIDSESFRSLLGNDGWLGVDVLSKAVSRL